MARIVLISGKAESGKDTVANFLMRKSVAEVCYSLHIAGCVKRIARESFGWDGLKDERGRALLQLIGDGGRQYDPNIWINEFLLDLDCVLSQTNGKNFLVVVPDVRYKNEVLKILDWGHKNNIEVLSIRVERPNHTNKLTKEQQLNGSETDLDNWGFWDVELINDGTLQDLEATTLNCMEVLNIEY